MKISHIITKLTTKLMVLFLILSLFIIAIKAGQWVDEFETDCSNGIDDDLDGLTDCNDNDCDGSIVGTVKNKETQQPIESVDVEAKKDLTTVKSAITSQDGSYSLNPINCGIYSLVVSHPDYATQVRVIDLLGRQQLTEDFELVIGTACESDCTYAFDNLVHVDCDGKNGCSFYDDIAKAACDLSEPGWIRDYNQTYYVVCASGSPEQKVEIEASVSCSSGTLVKTVRIVFYKGKPVKLVVATCG